MPDDTPHPAETPALESALRKLRGIVPVLSRDECDALLAAIERGATPDTYPIGRVCEQCGRRCGIGSYPAECPDCGVELVAPNPPGAGDATATGPAPIEEARAYSDEAWDRDHPDEARLWDVSTNAYMHGSRRTQAAHRDTQEITPSSGCVYADVKAPPPDGKCILPAQIAPGDESAIMDQENANMTHTSLLHDGIAPDDKDVITLRGQERDDDQRRVRDSGDGSGTDCNGPIAAFPVVAPSGVAPTLEAQAEAYANGRAGRRETRTPEGLVNWKMCVKDFMAGYRAKEQEHLKERECSECGADIRITRGMRFCSPCYHAVQRDAAETIKGLRAKEQESAKEIARLKDDLSERASDLEALGKQAHYVNAGNKELEGRIRQLEAANKALIESMYRLTLQASGTIEGIEAALQSPPAAPPAPPTEDTE